MAENKRAHLRLIVRRTLLAAALGLPVATYAAPEAAPPPTGDVPQLAEIVVTAQKVAQDLQNVPISIQVLTSRKLDELNTRSFDDYVKFLPSVAFTSGSTGLPGNDWVVFRGIATDSGLIASGTFPTVGVYLDEQPITSILGSVDIHMYDIARVEALAGPQGTLYGASSEAGTLRIITNKPDPHKFSAAYNLDVNKILVGGPGGGAEGYVNIPLIPEKVALRAVGWYEHTGGWIDNVFRARTMPSSGIVETNANLVGNDLNDDSAYGARAMLGIDLDENWTVTPAVIAQRQTWGGTFRSDDTKVGALKVAHYFPEFGSDSWYQAGLTITGKVSDFDVTYAGYYMNRTRDEHNDYSDYGFYYDALYGSGANEVNNAGQMVNPAQYNINYDNSDKLSQELRISTPQDRRIRATAGLFYERQRELTENDYLVAGFADDLSVPGRPGQLWLTKEQLNDRDKAAFGQVYFDLTHQLTLTGGIRAYRYDNSLVGFYGVNSTYFGTGVAQCLGAPVGPYGLGAALIGGTPCTNLGILNPDGSISPKSATGSGTTWRGNITYKLDPQHLLYGTVSTGFRPGGINRAGTAAPFLPDKLTNYELGTKNTLLDHRLALNLTLFYEQWKDVQVTYQAPGGSGVALIANAGGADSRGVEGDLRWQAGNGFSLTGSATVLHAKLTTPLYLGSPTPAAPAGQKLPLSPDFKGSLVARKEFPLGATMAHVQLAGSYIGERNSVLVTSDEQKTGPLPGYFTLDASAGGATGNFTYELYIRNLTDARGQVNRASECNINVCGPSSYDPVGEIYRIYIQPRTIGIRFGESF